MNPGEMNNLTPRAQHVLALARKEADKLNLNYVGTECLLLGIIRLGQGVGISVLQKLCPDLEVVRLEVEKRVGFGTGPREAGIPPYTPRVKKVLSLAAKEAKALNHTYVGTEHLLLGLLEGGEGGGVAAQVLKSFGLNTDQIRQEILRELDPNRQAEETFSGESQREETTGVEELGDSIITHLSNSFSGSAVLDCRDSRRSLIFLSLQLLQITGYSFKRFTILLALRLICEEVTMSELIIISISLGRKKANEIPVLQEIYDGLDSGSTDQFRAGLLLQVMTGQSPRKLGPEVDWLKLRGLRKDTTTPDQPASASVPPAPTPPPGDDELPPRGGSDPNPHKK